MGSFNLRPANTFVIALLVFCLLITQSATANPPKLPESLQDIVQGKSFDLTSVAANLQDTDLPSAFAIIEVLKFKALHQEISVTTEQVSDFEALIKNRLQSSSVVSYFETETCRNKVNSFEIEILGQKIIVPEHYIADSSLSIIGVNPVGEAGTLFPDLRIEIFSATPLTEISLSVNGQTINNQNLLLKQSLNTFEISYRTPALLENLMSIGTHTAEITIKNQADESESQQWTFTIGVYDASTPPIPDDVEVIGEIELPGSKLFPGKNISGNLHAIVYKDSSGNRYVEYRLTKPSGEIITSRNLAFISRQSLSKRSATENLTLLPKTTHAFIGNELAFSHAWSGTGKVLSTDWQITSGNMGTTESVVKMAGNTSAKCTVTIEETYTDHAGNQASFQYEVSAFRTIHALELNANIFSNRSLLISNNATASFALKAKADCIVIQSNATGIIEGNLAEGETYTQNSGATLKVERLRWKIHAQEGDPKIENPVATTTQILFTKPGFAELVLDVKLVWQHNGETYDSDFKPETSGLYAFYPVKGSAQFSKYPQGQLAASERHVVIKSFEFEIKRQKRVITAPEYTQLSQPIEICSSSLWPASSPLQITMANPLIFNARTGREIQKLDVFQFLTPMVLSDSSIELIFGAEFRDGVNSGISNKTTIARLNSIPVYEPDDIMQLLLRPSEKVTVFEGQEQIFKAEVIPVPGMGDGNLSDNSKTLDILNGYQVSSVDYLHWFEIPLGEEDDWKSRAIKATNFAHIFEPFLGPGSYTMNCGIVMNLRESDTGDQVPVYLDNSVPVDALPGLRIFSPIDQLAYPHNVSLKVITSFDKDPETWKSIKWRLNDKEFHHGLDNAPFYINLNRTGKWSLQAELTLKNPQTGEDMLLKDKVDFIVNPVEISLAPTRKVVDFTLQPSQELSLNITLNGNQIENVGHPVKWNHDGLEAAIDPIEWFSATAPNGCATINHDENSLNAGVNFARTGAATVLATVTVRLTNGEEYFQRRHKGFEDEFEEPIFTFPAVRADIWAIAKPSWTKLTSNLPDEQFPQQAVAPAGRTFSIKDGVVLLGKERFEWSPKTGFETPIAIPAAILDATILPATCNKVKFEWSCVDNNPSNDTTFIPTFKKAGAATVKLKSSLVFDGKHEIAFVEKNFTVSVQNIENLVQYYIEPETFQMNLGETKKFNFFISPRELSPLSTAGNRMLEFTILNGIYNVAVDKTYWSWAIASETFSINADSYFNFTPTIPGAYRLYCNANCRIIEAILPELDNSHSWLWQPTASNNVNVVADKPEIRFSVDNISLNDSPKIYLGQKIRLSFNAFLNGEAISISSYTWQVDPPFTSEFRVIGEDQSASEIIPGKVIDGQPVEFLVYSYNRHDKRKTFRLIYEYGGKQHIQAGYFPFLGPDIEKYGYKQAKPEIFRAGTVMRCGYYPPKHHIDYITGSNLTDARFLICVAQLVSLEFNRGFDDLSKEGFNFANYLDNGFPYTKNDPLVGRILPGMSLNEERFFEDIPSYPFQEVATASMPMWYESKSNFSVFVFFRPDLPNGYWVPVLRYNWTWRAYSERVGATWSEVEGAFFPPTDLNIESVREVPLTNNEASELGFPKWDKYYDNKDGFPWKKL